MHGSRIVTALAVSTVALVAVGGTACGGSDDGPGTLSKSAFAKQTNALCSKAKADRNALLQQLSPTPSGTADAQKLRSVATTDRELIRHVDALVPPDAEQDQVDKVLDAWRQRANVEGLYADAVGAMQDPATLASVTGNLAQIDSRTDPIAVQLGLTECTRGTP